MVLIKKVFISLAQHVLIFTKKHILCDVWSVGSDYNPCLSRAAIDIAITTVYIYSEF